MRFDEYGCRFIDVPSVKVAAEVICTDKSDTEFWSELEQVVGAPVRENLGIRSDYHHQTFLAREATPAPMETEIFAHEYLMKSLGSSRHLMKGRFLWKGIGRNQLAVQDDWLHSWGGMNFHEGVIEFLLSSLLGDRYAVPVKAFLRFKDQSDGGRFFLLRDQKWPRLATVPYNHNRDEYALNLKNKLTDIFEGNDPWKGLLTTITAPYRMGFVHRSPMSANFDIAGRILDLSGSFYFPGKDVECVWMDGQKVENPIDPIFWLVENCFAPLYARALGVSKGHLLRQAEVFFFDRFQLYRKSPQMIASHLAELPPEKKAQFGNWVVFPAKNAEAPVLPEKFISRKIELLAEGLSPESHATELESAINFALGSFR